ncbi:MAG: hypothetical protein JWP65_716 [Ramlibacter sp.]|jgi:hypothetical protein|uniref:hypothetical protein n=1 Tax=Ramlibacter sp. TaxID=1917967 RepID=UPI0026059AD2|nr:hypothetical protein [Ramlibacter sp.]MDB5750295.1 hypothetical protein [Ramlibacter sp.]
MQHQEIRQWSVAGDDRVVGLVYNRPGHADGQTIVTSRVVQVRLMGPAGTPVAFTESGSAYWLGDPARRFGLDNAETFVWRLSRNEPPPRDGHRERHTETTVLHALVPVE